MIDYMEELATAWIGWHRQRDAVQKKVIALIQSTDARFQDNETLRSSALKLLRESFYRVAIAEKLAESGDQTRSGKQLLSLADSIRDKRGYKLRKGGRDPDMRTAQEERYYATARVRWSNLLKKAGVAAADTRGGDTSMFRTA